MNTPLIDTSRASTAAPAMTRVAHLSAPLMNGLGAVLLLALSAWLWIGAADIESVGGSMLGPDSFPRLVAALLAGCCLLLLAQSVRAAIARSGASVAISRPFQVLAAIVLVCVYPPVIGVLGYYPATALWMPPFLLLAGMRHPVGVLASVCGFLLFTKVLFQMVLGTPLP